MNELSATKVGIHVRCTVCYRQKCPRGRSGAMTIPYCDFECEGYRQEPLVGDLWPGESEEDFGYPCSDKGTEQREAKKCPQ